MGLSGVRSAGVYDTGVTGDVHAPASNTAAIVTYNADATNKHCISGVAYSYDVLPTAGKNLKIEDGAGTVIFSIDIVSAKNGEIYFNPPKIGSLNTNLIITLAAGGAGITGKVSILGHWIEKP